MSYKCQILRNTSEFIVFNISELLSFPRRVIWNGPCPSTTITSFTGATSSCPRTVPEHPRGLGPDLDPGPGRRRRRAVAVPGRALAAALGAAEVARGDGLADPSPRLDQGPGLDPNPGPSLDPSQGPSLGPGAMTRKETRARRRTTGPLRKVRTERGPGKPTIQETISKADSKIPLSSLPC